MYTIDSSKSYDEKYVSDTKRLLKIRVREHKDEVEKIGYGMPFTRRNRNTSETKRYKSAITDHVVKKEHVMDRDSASIVLKESDWRTRGIKESIIIRTNPQNINRDEGRHFLSNLYDDLLPGEGHNRFNLW